MDAQQQQPLGGRGRGGRGRNDTPSNNATEQQGRGRGGRNDTPSNNATEQQGRGRGGRNSNNQNNQPKDNTPKHVDPTATTVPRDNRDRRDTRGGSNKAEVNTAAPVENTNARGGRSRGRGGNNAEKPKDDEVAADKSKSSFSVSAAPSAVAVAAPTSTTTFEKLGLIPELLKAVNELGYKTPTPIQQQAIPKVLDGKDVLAGAQTGTGKTAGFALPILQLLCGKYIVNGKAPAAPRGGNPLRVLVLTPTRELAAQVHDNFRDLSKFLPQSFFSTTVIVGGVGQSQQVAELKKRPTVLVATPGRLLDFHQQGGIVDLSQIEYCVLDEADRMLDMGFYPDVSKILALLPKNKQSLLFSATFSSEIRSLAAKILRSPMAEVQVTPPNSTVERIQQSYYLVSRDAKDEALTHIIQTNKWDQVLVFTRTKGGANHVSAMLAKNKITSLALHGGKSQTARTTALADFKSGKLRVLVATDIAARGLDIEDLPHVVNYEIPNVSEDYVHRIGRTGRAGKEGYAVSLVCLDEEGFLNNILKFAGKADIPRKTDLPAAFSPPKDEFAQPIAMGRMTLWGGAGPMPSKAIMDAAGKEKRREIANNIRDRKDAERQAKTTKEAAKNTRAAAAGSNSNNNAKTANNNNGPKPANTNTTAKPQSNSTNKQQQQPQSGRGTSRGGFGNNSENTGRGGRGAARGGRQ